MFGSLMGTPIINLPQTGRTPILAFTISSLLLLTHILCRFLLNVIIAVLGLHAIKEKPVVVDGKIEIRPVCHTQIPYFQLAKSSR